MNKQEYLDQISAKPAPKTVGLPAFFHSKFFWIILVAVLFLCVILGIGSSLSGQKITNKDRIPELILHLNGLSESIGEYQDSIKSSALRGYSASLASVISATSTDLTNYATQAYKYKEKNIPKPIQAKVAEHITELNDELFDAKINGDLDEIYDLKMLYEISLILAQEQEIRENTDNTELTSKLESSAKSLKTLQTKFDEYELGM